ncbi:MAG TPA: hypothetical protein VEQ85_09495 [Lacipirellulaceae bacterium]|nr:hypothetical protein [Lacipirellulaceae bacterium]
MKPFTTLTGKIAAMAAVVVAGAVCITRAAETETLEVVREDLDIDNDGRVDWHVETRQLSEKISLRSVESMDRVTGKLKARVISLDADGRRFWSETFVPANRNRFTDFNAGSPFAVSSQDMDGSGNPHIAVLDEDQNIIAYLERDQDGRLAPASEETIRQGEAVAEALIGAIGDILTQEDGASSKVPDNPAGRE